MNKFLDFDTLLLTRGTEDPLVTETLVRTAYGPIYQLATVALRDPSQAESISKVILLSALEKLNEYFPGTNFNTWLFTLAVQVCREYQRKTRWKYLFTKPSKSKETSEYKPGVLGDINDKLRLPVILAYSFELEIPEIAIVLNLRESTIQARIEKAINTLEFPDIEEGEQIQALRAEIARQYPFPPAPPEGFSALIESLNQQVQQKSAHLPRFRFRAWEELSWVGLALAILAGIYLTVNRTSSDNTTLPLFPSPTPPLPEVIIPNKAQTSEQPVVEIDIPQYASEPVISANGTTIVYTVHGNNGQNIHIYDRETGQAVPIALSPEGNQGYSYNDLYSPDISDDGARVVFAATSMEGSFFACPDNSYSACSQIVLYEREEHTWTIVSSNPAGQTGNGNSILPIISGDGRYVAFWSFADNLAPGDDETCEGPMPKHNCGDIFIKDLQTSAIQRIRVGKNQTQSVERLDLSTHGEWLVFTLSNMDKLEQEKHLTQNSDDVFAVHLPSGEFHLINISSNGEPGNNPSYLGTISGDSRSIAFVSAASNLSVDDTNGENDVFLHDLQTGDTDQISMGPYGEQPDGPSGMFPEYWDARMSISANGKWVVFMSFAPNILTHSNTICPPNLEGSNFCYGLFRYDRETGKTIPLNIQPLGAALQPEAVLLYPSISSDGRWVSLMGAMWFISENCPVGACSDVYLLDTQREEILPVSGPLPEVPDEYGWRFQTYLEGHGTWVNAVAISPDGRFLASAGQESKLLLWNLADERILKSLQIADTPLNTVAFSPDGTFLAAGDQDGVVCVFTMPEGENFKCLASHPGQVRRVAFSPDGVLLAVASQGSVRMWRFVDEEIVLVREYPYPGGLVESIAFSPDGELLAAAVNDEIWLREVDDGEVISRSDGHDARIFDLAFSPDGQFLASCSSDQTAALWKVQKTGTGWAFEFLYTLLHNDWVRTLAFSPDSTILATGSFDSSIALWEIPGGQYLQTLRRTTQDQVIDLAFSPDGDQIAAGTVRGLRLWTYGPFDAALPPSTTFFSFRKGEQWTTNHLYLVTSPRGVSVEPTIVFSIEEAQPLVSFPIREPENLPPGFTLSGIYIFNDLALEIVSLTYLRTTSFQPAFLTITQSRTNPIHFDFQLGEHAYVGRTYVNGQAAELVNGGWNTTSTSTNADGQLIAHRIWDEELASRWLRWQEGDIYFSILYDQPFNEQSIGETDRFPVEQLIEIAESLR